MGNFKVISVDEGYIGNTFEFDTAAEAEAFSSGYACGADAYGGDGSLTLTRADILAYGSEYADRDWFSKVCEMFGVDEAEVMS